MSSDDQIIICDINIGESGYTPSPLIISKIETAHLELENLDATIALVSDLSPNCDKTDYILSAISGLLCGLIDIFLVEAPKQGSMLGHMTDKWANSCIDKFASFCGWDTHASSKTAIAFLEERFKIPYDQIGLSGPSREVFGLSPSNHHFKSLAHNPSICGLVFSIIDQFTNQSHFVSDGQLISLQDANPKFCLRGNTVVTKLFYGFVNWVGHIISDAGGSSLSYVKAHRGSGIPSPLWTWINSIIALKAELGLSSTEVERSIETIAVEVYKQGVDLRFALAQSIPVVLNELIVRFFYSARRFISLYRSEKLKSYTWSEIWNICKPYQSPSLTRMLTVAHGVFCALDLGDAVIEAFLKGGGNFNPVEFFVRFNIIGVGRFGLALYSEVKMDIEYRNAKQRASMAKKDKRVIEEYIQSLHKLGEYYNDKNFIDFVKLLAASKDVEIVFKQSCEVAIKRGVHEPLKTKMDIDNYFNSNKYGKNR